MNITEIITNPPRDEYLDQYQNKFSHADTVARIKNLALKKLSSPTETEYVLFDEQDRLVGYFALEYRGNSIWEVTLVQLAQAYRGMGFGTFFYDYAVMNDKLKIMSDATQTSGPDGSRDLWMRLRNNSRYRVVGYDTKTQTIVDPVTPADIYDNTPSTRWLALPPGETINESLTRIQSNMKKRHVVWYGPGTSTRDYFNF
jgi:hypothetical protein